LNGEKRQRLDQTGQAMIEFIEKICNDVGPRPGGSEAEQKAGTIIFNEFSDFCDEVIKDHFTCHPQGFLDFIWITALLYILGFVSYFFMHPFVSVLLISAAIGIYFVQQNLLWEMIDFLFPKKESFHVIGKIKPVNKPVKNLILLSGHYDSAYEFPLLNKLGGNSIYVIISTLLIAFLNIALGIVKTIFVVIDRNIVQPSVFDFPHSIQNFILPTPIDWLQLFLFTIGTFVIIILAIFLRSNKAVMGANDNLTAIAAIIECGRYLIANKPDQTEVWLIAFAGEEHMRGSKRFVSHYYEELKQRKAMLLNLECLNTNEFLLATAENMFLAKHSPTIVEKVAKAAKKVNVPIEIGPLRFAGSDAANFSRKGLPATTIFGLSETGMPSYWHSLEDTADKLNGSYIVRAAEIALQFVYDIDKE
jgi:hypothetical protein